MDIKIGKNIRTRRKQLGISQKSLGEAVGVTFQQIQKYERAENKITAVKLYKVAKALKVTAGYFFKDSKLKKPSTDVS